MCNFYIMYWTFGDVLKTKNWLVYYFIFFWFWLIIILFYNFASFYSVDLVFLMVRRFTIGLVVDWIMFQRMLLLYDFFKLLLIYSTLRISIFYKTWPISLFHFLKIVIHKLICIVFSFILFILQWHQCFGTMRLLLVLHQECVSFFILFLKINIACS